MQGESKAIELLQMVFQRICRRVEAVILAITCSKSIQRCTGLMICQKLISETNPVICCWICPYFQKYFLINFHAVLILFQKRLFFSCKRQIFFQYLFYCNQGTGTFFIAAGNNFITAPEQIIKFQRDCAHFDWSLIF